ncbi:MAG: DUF805 domain-containing protein [Caulobacter sp.]|nr:DUF805 domain-containing protein [Caulobacter sp.]
MTAINLYSFKGRSGRMAFALTQIGVFTFSYVAIFLLIVFSGAGDETGAKVTWLGRGAVAILSALLAVNAVWISLAVAVRRCHDRSLSGWMLLFVMPPILGQLWLVLSLITGPGAPGFNRHGLRKPTYTPKPRWADDLSQLDALA